MGKKKRLPHVGDIAMHHGGLDSRPVAEVSEDKMRVKLSIHGYLTDWVPASNYDFREV